MANGYMTQLLKDYNSTQIEPAGAADLALESHTCVPGALQVQIRWIYLGAVHHVETEMIIFASHNDLTISHPDVPPFTCKLSTISIDCCTKS